MNPLGGRNHHKSQVLCSLKMTYRKMSLEWRHAPKRFGIPFIVSGHVQPLLPHPTASAICVGRPTLQYSTKLARNFGFLGGRR